MGNTVYGDLGDVFYCYVDGEEGWYKVVDPENKKTVRIDESEVDPDDIQDPPVLENWWEFDAIDDSSYGGGYNGKGSKYNDLQSFVSEHTGTGPGGYFTKDDLRNIAKGRFDGNDNIPPHVRDQATALLKSGKFDDLAGDDSLFHSWNFDEMNGKPAPAPNRKTSAQNLRTLLEDNGSFAKRADIELIANTGTYKGMKVSDAVRDEAKNLMANNGKLFNERAGDDGVIAPWDLDGTSYSSTPDNSTPDSSTPYNSTPYNSTPYNSTPNSSTPPTSKPGGKPVTDGNSAIERMIELFGIEDPTGAMVEDIRKRAGTTDENINPSHVRRAIEDPDIPPEKKELYQWIFDNFKQIDNAKENLAGAGTGTRNGDDGLIGPGDFQAFFGWSGGRGPKDRVDLFPSYPSDFKFTNPNGFTGTDLSKLYSNKYSPYDDLINDMKAKAGADSLYLERGTVKRVMDTETDPVKKRLYQVIYENFESIDKGKNKDGWIGGADVQKWLGW